MSSKFSSSFDDLLAKSADQMNDLMGPRSSSVLPAPTAAPLSTKPQGTNETETAATVITGTSGGIAFTLTTK